VGTVSLPSAIGRTGRRELHAAEARLSIRAGAACGIVLADIVIVDPRDGVPVKNGIYDESCTNGGSCKGKVRIRTLEGSCTCVYVGRAVAY
jgi:hypothetical protein